MAASGWVWIRAVVMSAVAASAVAFTASPKALAAVAPPLFIVDEGPYEPTDDELTIDVINLSGEALTLELEGAECGGTDPERVPGHTSGQVTFELAPGCDVDDPVPVAVVGTSGDATDTIEITLTAADDDEESDFAPLAGFAIGVGAALVLTLGALVMACGKPTRAEMGEQMRWLDAKWSFDESWAATTGLAAALFTGLFGATDVLAELLGKDADVTVAIVAAATSAGLVGAAPMLLAMFQTEGQHTRWGVSLGTWCVLSAHIGLILTLVLMLHGDEVTGAASKAIGAGAIVLLAFYTVRTLPSVLTKPPPDDGPAEKSDEVAALEKIAAAINRAASTSAAALPGHVPSPTVQAPQRATAPAPRRRAALI